MSLYLRAPEAARRLGVSKPTLYAYVSRGLIERRAGPDGRSSLYAAEDVERLRSRARRAPSRPLPTIDVQIASAVTRLDDETVRYRGHDVTELARTATFEQAAELLWTGSLPTAPVRWPTPAADDVTAARAAVALAPEAAPLARLLTVSAVVGARHPDDDAPTAARRLIGVVADLDRSHKGSIADRLARSWRPGAPAVLRAAVDRALVLLADHELATSTLAVRAAASVRAPAPACLAAGLATVAGRLHGSAAAGTHALLVEAATSSPAAAVARRIERRERLPGFGHSVYRTGDPRLEPLLDAVRTLPDPDDRLAVVDAVRLHAGSRVAIQPNVDFGLAALAFVGGLDPDVPLFAVARLAGWAAHVVEEETERPVRFRGLSTPP